MVQNCGTIPSRQAGGDLIRGRKDMPKAKTSKEKKKEDKSSEQAHAYTPGLKVKRAMFVSKERRLPVPGKVLVNEGEAIKHDSIVAETFVRGDPYVLKVAVTLSIDPQEIMDYMVKKSGEHVSKDEPVAKYIGFFGLIKRFVNSPVSGVVESVSDATGQVIVRGDPIPVNVNAYIPGKAVKVMPREGVVIETEAAFIQGIFGIGGETYGKLKVVVRSPDEVLDAEKILSEHKGHVLVGGSEITLEALRKAVQVGVSGIVAGGVRHLALREFMGRDIGVAITGEEELGVTMIITEGFGRMTMSDRTFDLLKFFDGYLVHINGATQIRAGVQRPEIIIPHSETFEDKAIEFSSGMVPGTPVRIIRQPYFGAIGKVVSLPIELQVAESESEVRVVEVEIEGGKRVVVPRANVEIIEE